MQRPEQHGRRVWVVAIIAAVIVAIALRLYFFNVQTFDYTYYLKNWSDILLVQGPKAFKENFSNYNSPYLILLLLGTYIPIPSLYFIKGLSVVFDVFLAYNVWLIVSLLKPKGNIKYLAALVTLFLPTVVINSSVWGQSDSITTSFMLLSFYSCLKDRDDSMWFWWGIAFSFKPQAIFMLPFLLYVSIARRIRWYYPLYAAGIFILMSSLPLFEGRSIVSTFSTYISQSQPQTAAELTKNAPNLYKLLPSGYLTLERYLGDTLMVLTTAGFCALGVVKRKVTKAHLLLLFTLSLYVVPFVLPGMHERYFYPAEIASIMLAFTVADFLWVAVAMQVITLNAYIPYLTGYPHGRLPFIPFSIMALGVAVIILFLYKYAFLRKSDSKQTDSPG